MTLPPNVNRQMTSTLSLLGIGLAVLGYLEVIEHPQWFHIRPATGTSLAMAHAAAPATPATATAATATPQAQPTH